MAGSVEALNRISKRYAVIYLTHRPDLLTRKSKTWLTTTATPPGRC